MATRSTSSSSLAYRRVSALLAAISSVAGIRGEDDRIFDSEPVRFRIVTLAHRERLLEGVLGRLREVRSVPEGYIYLLTDDGDDVLTRLEPI